MLTFLVLTLDLNPQLPVGRVIAQNLMGAGGRSDMLATSTRDEKAPVAETPARWWRERTLDALCVALW